MAKLASRGRQLSGKEKLLLRSVIVLSVTFIYWVLVLSPALSSLTPLKDEVNSLEKQVGDTGLIKSEIDKNKETFDKLQVQYQEATKVIPKTDRYPELIKDIRELVTSSGLKLTGETFGKPEVFVEPTATEGVKTEGNAAPPAQPEGAPVVSHGLHTLTLTINIEGEFNKVLDLVNKLEKDTRILDVKKVSSDNKSTTLTLVYYIAGGEEKENYDFNPGPVGNESIFN